MFLETNHPCLGRKLARVSFVYDVACAVVVNNLHGVEEQRGKLFRGLKGFGLASQRSCFRFAGDAVGAAAAAGAAVLVSRPSSEMR